MNWSVIVRTMWPVPVAFGAAALLLHDMFSQSPRGERAAWKELGRSVLLRLGITLAFILCTALIAWACQRWFRVGPLVSVPVVIGSFLLYLSAARPLWWWESGRFSRHRRWYGDDFMVYWTAALGVASLALGAYMLWRGITHP